jgi:hypothetical protein
LVRINRVDEAADHAREAVRLLTPLDRPQALGWAQFQVAICSTEEGYENLDEVADLWSVCHASFAEAGHVPGKQLAKLFLDVVEHMREPSGPVEGFERLGNEAEEIGNANVAAHTWEILGSIKCERGELDEAGPLLHRALELHTTIGNWACVAHCVERSVGSFLLGRGLLTDAARLVGATETMRMNLSTVEAPYERVIPDFYRWAETIDESAELDAARTEGRRWSRDALIAQAFEYVKAPSNQRPISAPAALRLR